MSFRDQKIKQIIQEDQLRYNTGLIQMAKKEYESSEGELQRCLRLRVFMYGPYDYRVAVTHEALGDLKFRMMKDKELDSSSDYRDSAIKHYEAALRSVEKDFCRIPDEEMREILQEDFNHQQETESEKGRRGSVCDMIKNAEVLSNKMKMRSSGITVEVGEKQKIKKSSSREEVVKITKRLMTNMKRLQDQ